MVTTRLPEWRYQIRRTTVGLILATVAVIAVATLTSRLGVDLCAEDICYQRLPATK